jgi:hypothetical protein
VANKPVSACGVLWRILNVAVLSAPVFADAACAATDRVGLSVGMSVIDLTQASVDESSDPSIERRVFLNLTGKF